MMMMMMMMILVNTIKLILYSYVPGTVLSTLNVLLTPLLFSINTAINHCPGPWWGLSSMNWSLGPKRLGTAALKHSHLKQVTWELELPTSPPAAFKGR